MQLENYHIVERQEAKEGEDGGKGRGKREEEKEKRKTKNIKILKKKNEVVQPKHRTFQSLPSL